MDQFPPLQYFGVKNYQLKSSDSNSLETCDVLDTSQPVSYSVKRGDRLRVSYGVVPDAKPPAPNAVPKVYEFDINIDGSRNPIFHRVLIPTTVAVDRGWHHVDLRLDRWAGHRVNFHFTSSVLNFTGKNPGGAEPSKAAIWGGLRIGNYRREAGQYNIIMISLDTLRADHLGYMGYSRDTSPNLDRMAKSGVWFRQAIAQSPWTKPSHMSVFTGLLPSHHNQTERLDLDNGMIELSPNIPTIPEILRRNGFVTQAFTGSGYVSARFGFARGFDHYIETVNLFKNEGKFIFGSAEDWIEHHRDERFFLFLHTFEVHSPYKHRHFDTAAIHGDHDRVVAQYDSGIYFVDGLVGDIENTLDKLDIRGQTLVVVFSDHGEELSQRGYDLQHGHTLYDELLRVPLIFSWPGHLNPREVNDIQAQHVDILPTVLDLLKIADRPALLDGQSLAASLAGVPNTRPSVVISEAVEYGALDLRSIRCMDGGLYKFIISPSVAAGAPDMRDNRNPYWLEYVIPNGGREFYDLSSDPGERNNLIETPSSKEQEMEQDLRRYIAETGSVQTSRAGLPVDSELRDRLRSLGY